VPDPDLDAVADSLYERTKRHKGHGLFDSATAPQGIFLPQPDRKKMVEDDRVITKMGIHFYPLVLAAPLAQIPRTTLLDWIRKGVKIEGAPLQTYNSATTRKRYLSETSVKKLAERFVKWPSNEPAGRVTIGQTPELNGYVGLPQAARTLGIDHHTVWLWVTRGNVPKLHPGESLDVIKCPIADHFYIRERDVVRLKSLLRGTGPQRGRNRQTTPQP
jgi:hypothetical protein